MRDKILGHWRTFTATIFSVILIAGVYVLARGVESPPIAQASAESELLHAIASKDSDGDSLPDWQESLYGTDPHKTDSSNLGMTDGEAVVRGLIIPLAIADVPVASSSAATLDAEGLPPAPAEGTLTAAFTKTFFALFLAAKQANGGGDLSESQMQDVSNQALQSLAQMVTIAPDFKSVKDLIVSGSGPDDLKLFAEKAEGVLLRNTSTATTSEINYLKYAVENNDAEALSQLISIAKTYRNSAVGLATIPVPKEFIEVDLVLINAMMRLSRITSDFAKVNDDPLATMLALKQYPDAVLALGNAFIKIGTIYKTSGISLTADAPGAEFVNLVSDIVASQQSPQKP